MQLMLEQLDITKADKALIREQMSVVSGPLGEAGGGGSSCPPQVQALRRLRPLPGARERRGRQGRAGQGLRASDLVVDSLSSGEIRHAQRETRWFSPTPGRLFQKADKSALETKVNHGELQVATTQLSEMMQDLLQKMSLQDKDWQKALEKLFTDMDCKVTLVAAARSLCSRPPG